MTDRELLEAAAKAAGIELRPLVIKPAIGEGNGFIGYLMDPKQWPSGWFDPLTDDGDALRLAVKLHMSLDLFYDGIVVGYTRNGESEQLQEVDGTCIYAATRRAIVRAAAAIGAGTIVKISA
jgi:hypothetical protein